MIINIYQAYLNENGNLKRETHLAWLQNFTWGRSYEIDNLKMWKLIIHGNKQMHGGDLSFGMETLTYFEKFLLHDLVPPKKSLIAEIDRFF